MDQYRTFLCIAAAFYQSRSPQHQQQSSKCVYPVCCHKVLLLHSFNGPLSRTTWVNRYQKGKTNLDLLEQETVNGSGISWAICKSAPRPRQITMPAYHHSVFLQARCPSCCPTNSVKALKALLL